MTHEELLKKIVVDDYYNADEVLVQQNALRAVVELHKPQNKHEVEFGLAKCNGCYMSYPCQTIQAIEKELNG